MYYVRTAMKRLLFSIGFLVAWLLGSPCVLAQQPAPPHPKVLAFFTVGGELDHWLFAQQAMRAFGSRARTFAASSFEVQWSAAAPRTLARSTSA